AYSVSQGEEPAFLLKLGEKAAVKDGKEELVLFLTEEQESAPVYYLGERKEIAISSHDQEADVYFSEMDPFFGNQATFSIIRLEDQWNVIPNGANVYMNGEKITAPASLQNGDEILFGLNTFRIIEGDLLEINAREPFETALEQTVKPSSE
ncbi:type VII secretion protein EssC, partial [Klebsiella pneumoniae]|nr:type VII secretion protein EssC [Klebsiella pneumoniae]